MSEWLIAVLGAGGLAFASTTVGGLLLWRRAEAAHRATLVDLDRALADQDELQESLSRQATATNELTAAHEASEERRRAAIATAQRIELALEESKRRMASFQEQIREQDARLIDSETRRKRAEDRLRDQQSELRNMALATRRTRQLLSSLGIGFPEHHQAPLDPGRRPITRDTVQQLLLDCGATATALVHDSGLEVFGAGQDAGVTRIATTAAWLAHAEGALAEVLCAPVDSWSVMDRRLCTHLLRIRGTDLRVGVENLGNAPLFAMRHAHLRMVELPAPDHAVPNLGDLVVDLDHAPDEELGEKVTRWARRWGADAVTVLDVEGRPLAATVAAQPGPVMALRRALNPALERMLRDGRFLDDVSLIARSTDGATLTVRMVGEDLEAPMVAIVGPAEVPDRALDELSGTLRWHLNNHPHAAREAS